MAQVNHAAELLDPVKRLVSARCMQSCCRYNIAQYFTINLKKYWEARSGWKGKKREREEEEEEEEGEKVEEEEKKKREKRKTRREKTLFICSGLEPVS